MRASRRSGGLLLWGLLFMAMAGPAVGQEESPPPAGPPGPVVRVEIQGALVPVARELPKHALR